MQQGLIIFYWDDIEGADLLTSYPKTLEPNDSMILHLQSQHDTHKEPGTIAITTGRLNVASYFSGLLSNLYIVFSLDSDYYADEFLFAVQQVAPEIMRHLDLETIVSPEKSTERKAMIADLDVLLPSYYNRIEASHSVNEEQRLGALISGAIFQDISKKLHDLGIVRVDYLESYFETQYANIHVEIRGILRGLADYGIIHLEHFGDQGGELIFLIKDIIFFQVPPRSIESSNADNILSADLIPAYLDEVRGYFQAYSPDYGSDQRIIKQVLLDPECYKFLTMIRNHAVNKEEVEKAFNPIGGITSADRLIRELYNFRLLIILKDRENNDLFIQNADFLFKMVVPEYLVSKIQNEYIKGEMPAAILTFYMALLLTQMGLEEKRGK